MCRGQILQTDGATLGCVLTVKHPQNVLLTAVYSL